MDSAASGRDSSGSPRPCFLLMLPAKYARVSSEEPVDPRAGLFHCELQIEFVSGELDPGRDTPVSIDAIIEAPGRGEPNHERVGTCALLESY